MMKISDLEAGDMIRAISSNSLFLNNKDCEILHVLCGDRLAHITFKATNGNIIYMAYSKDKKVSDYFEIISLKE